MYKSTKASTLFYFLFLLVLTIVLLTTCAPLRHAPTPDHHAPKHEFRGAWIQTAWQDRFMRMNSAEMRQYISHMVQQLYDAGINAIMFQIRPEGDAFYRSDIEPWSRFMTGEQGRAPDDPTFDPLAFIIEETHRRGMEIHAWINPFRAKTNVAHPLAPNHLFHRYPERFFHYGNQLIFDPGVPANRAHIVRVVRDIVSRYNIDAIHFDDYFYPFPIAGQIIQDDRSFARYASAQGFLPHQRNEWRRNNVNLLIREVSDAITLTKPWVRFGISPFGIYRNRSSYAGGSNTNGLQNYDDLFADVLLWLREGWIDHVIPQLYWEIGHRLADYTTLLQWWSQNSFGRPLYIGQCIERSLNQNELETKVTLARQTPNVGGNVFWYGYRIIENRDGAADLLRNNIHQYRALIPPYRHLHAGRPDRVRRVSDVRMGDMHLLTWQHNGNPNVPTSPQRFVVYRFREGEPVNTNRAQNIVAVTTDNFFILPSERRGTTYTYAVTSLDAFWNESRARTRRVRF